MPIVVHQAVFGDVNGAHNLIAKTPDAPEALLHRLVDFTDRTLPAEIVYESYISGFPLDTHYILTRTFSNPRASRLGMVHTHVLLLDKKACVQMQCLSVLIQLLPLYVPETIDNLPTLHLENDKNLVCPEDDPNLPKGYPAVVAALLSDRIPIWIERDGFEQIVCRLWRHLWQEARSKFSFRMSASPNDLEEQPATVVCTLPELRLRWGSSQLIDRNSDASSDLSSSEALLLGLPSGKLLHEVRERLGLHFADLAFLKKLERYVELLSADTEESIYSAGRLLSKIAPEPTQAPQEKSTLLKHIVKKATAGGEETVLRWRNFDVLPFVDGASAVMECVHTHIANNIQHGHGGLVVATETFIAEHPWKANASQGITNAFKPWRKRCAVILWEWWQMEPKLLSCLWSVLPTGAQGEADLIATMPQTISATLLKSILAKCARQEWYELHARLLIGSDLAPLEKFQRQISVDTAEWSVRGLNTLSEALGGFEILTAALHTGDIRLIQMAGAAMAKDFTLKHDLNTTDPTWRAIWLRCIENGGEVVMGLENPTTAVHSLMDAILSGQHVDGVLLQHIAPYADLVDYGSRPHIWKSLPYAVAEETKATTATYWLRRFLEDPVFDTSLEAELEPYILSSYRRQMAGTPEAITRLHRRFSALNETDVLAWLNTLNSSSLTSLSAIGLGQMIREKSWFQAATQILDRAWNKFPHFALAAQECRSLLSFLNKAKLGLLSKQPNLNEEDWWRAWQELATDLYPHGVDQNHIWGNAAGDRAKVRGHSGSEQWASALDLLRRGGAGKKITTLGLLHEMRKDYLINENLKVLEEFYKTYFEH